MENSKVEKKILKEVDGILEKIDACLPKDSTVSLVAAIFNLYIEIYKK